MKQNKIPTLTVDFIKYLKQRYPDKFETYDKVVDTPEYWKKAGIIELIREMEKLIEKGV